MKMQKITVITPSRIHMALIDLNGGLGRVDGGIGLSLASPGFRNTVERVIQASGAVRETVTVTQNRAKPNIILFVAEDLDLLTLGARHLQRQRETVLV